MRWKSPPYPSQDTNMLERAGEESDCEYPISWCLECSMAKASPTRATLHEVHAENRIAPELFAFYCTLSLFGLFSFPSWGSPHRKCNSLSTVALRRVEVCVCAFLVAWFAGNSGMVIVKPHTGLCCASREKAVLPQGRLYLYANFCSSLFALLWFLKRELPVRCCLAGTVRIIFVK